MTDHIDMPQLGPEGDACSACRAPLAVDQRYCLQCGQRRGATRVDFAELLPAEPALASGPEPGSRGATVVQPGQQSPWTPLSIVGSIATLGLMLLLGVMIGKDDSPNQVAAAAPAATPAVASSDASGGASGGDANTANGGGAAGGSGPKDVSDAGKGGGGGSEDTAPASTAPGAETIDEGALEALEGQTGQDAADASKNLPDTIALPGEPPPTDNEAPGGGSDAQVIK